MVIAPSIESTGIPGMSTIAPTAPSPDRPEAVQAGTVKLVGTDVDTICEQVHALLSDEAYYKTMSQAHNPYGDGKACERIVQFLQQQS